MRYLGALEDTRVDLEGGAAMLDMGAFNFPLAGSAIDTVDTKGTADSPVGSSTFSFLGTVELTAHGGMLSVALRQPQLAITGSNSMLTIDDGAGHRMALCHLEGGAYEALGEDLVWSADNVFLTEAGVQTFGGQYQAGQMLDPVLVRIPLP